MKPPMMFREAKLPKDFPPPGPVGEVIVKQYPPYRAAWTTAPAGSRNASNAMFRPLFNHIKKNDIPAGEFRWLTVVSPEGPGDVELVLEPNANPAAKAYQAALFEQGIPLTAFAVKDIHAEYARLKERGVVFRSEPFAVGPTTIALFEDTCGNLIQIYQE